MGLGGRVLDDSDEELDDHRDVCLVIDKRGALEVTGELIGANEMYCKVQSISKEDLNLTFWNRMNERRNFASLPAGATRYVCIETENSDHYGNDTMEKITVDETGETWNDGRACGRPGIWKRQQIPD